MGHRYISTLHNKHFKPVHVNRRFLEIEITVDGNAGSSSPRAFVITRPRVIHRKSDEDQNGTGNSHCRSNETHDHAE